MVGAPSAINSSLRWWAPGGRRRPPTRRPEGRSVCLRVGRSLPPAAEIKSVCLAGEVVPGVLERLRGFFRRLTCQHLLGLDPQLVLEARY